MSLLFPTMTQTQRSKGEKPWQGARPDIPRSGRQPEFVSEGGCKSGEDRCKHAGAKHVYPESPEHDNRAETCAERGSRKQGALENRGGQQQGNGDGRAADQKNGQPGGEHMTPAQQLSETEVMTDGCACDQ